MGLILDSSVAIFAERRGHTVEQLIEQVFLVSPDQPAALSAVGLTEMLHGIYRAGSEQVRSRRTEFVSELVASFTVYPFTHETAKLAGRVGGRQAAMGITIPFADLLIGATALSLGFAVLTANVRHFRLIPGLDVLAF